MRAEFTEIRTDFNELRSEFSALRTEVHDMNRRLGRVEGLLGLSGLRAMNRGTGGLARFNIDGFCAGFKLKSVLDS